MEALIRALLGEAVRAPSGDNMQPWHFRLAADVLFIENIPGRDASLYNWNEYGSYIAHGALIENISLLAPCFGLAAHITILPEGGASNITAQIDFSSAPEGIECDALIQKAISERATNRKAYEEGAPLDGAFLDTLNHFFEGDTDGFSLELIRDSVKRKKIGVAVAENELVLFSNRKLHDFFFQHIHWQNDAEKHSTEAMLGFPEATLEIPSQGKPIFRAMRSFAITRILHFIGLTRLIAKDNARLYASGSAIGIISSENSLLSRQDFLLFGRKLQRCWLEATLRGYQFQPLMGICFLARRITEGGNELSPEEAMLVRQAHETIGDITGVESNKIVGLFRIGKSDLPSEKTLRTPPSIVLV